MNPRSLVHTALAFAEEKETDPTKRFEPTGVVRRNSVGWWVVPLQQTHGGVPVLHGIRAVRFDGRSTPVAFTGTSINVDASTAIFPAVLPEEAARVAFLELARLGSVPSDLKFSAAAPDVVARLGTPDGAAVLAKEPMDGPILARLVIDATGKQTRLLWEIRLRLPKAGGGFVVRVDATASTELPAVRNVMRSSSHAITASVFEFDPRTSARTVPLPLPLQAYPNLPSSRPPGIDWVRGGETCGRNVDVKCDGQRIQARVTNSDLTFKAKEPLGLKGAAINAFFLCNFLHDFFYFLGFNEITGNFEAEHGTGGSVRGDPLKVLIQPKELPGLAFFDSYPDGESPILELGPHVNGRHSAFDAHIVVHEYAHGVTNRIVGGAKHRPLQHEQSRALGEGFSDYWAITIQNYYRRRAARIADEDPDTGQEWCFASWFSGTTTGLRSQSYQAHSGKYGSLSESGMNPQRAGEVWCATLLDIHKALGCGDADSGNELGWPLVMDSLGFLHPGKKGPHFLHARDAILCSLDLHIAEGKIPKERRQAVLKAFQLRGLGGNASSRNARYRRAKEDYEPIRDDYKKNCEKHE